MKNKVSFKEKLCYSIGAFGENMVYFLVSSYLMFFYTDVFKIPLAAISIIFLLARAWDALDDPVTGVLIDRTHTKYGRFRPYLIIGSPLIAIATVLLFTKIGGPMWLKIVYVSVTYLLWGIFYSFYDISYFSMLPAMTQDQAERTRIVSFFRIFAFGSTIIAGLCLMPIVKAVGKKSDAAGWQVAAILFSVFFVVCAVICFLNTREKVTLSEHKEKVSFRKAAKTIAANRPVLLLLVITLLFGVFFNLRNCMLIYYLKYNMGNDMLTVSFSVSTAIASMVGVVIESLTAGKIKKLNSLIMAACIMLSGFLMSYLCGVNVILQLIANCLIAGGAGISTVAGQSMMADAVEYGEWKTGIRSESIVFSSSSFAAKLTATISGASTALALAICAFQPNVQQTPHVLSIIKLMISIIPAIGLLLCVVPIFRYPLNESLYKKIQGEIAAGRVGENRRTLEEINANPEV